MTFVGWLVVATLAVVLAWLGLALAGLVREQTKLRARVDELESRSAPIVLGDGLPVGRQVPEWSIATVDGDVLSSSAFAGTRHAIVFADADCSACHEVVPDVVRASEHGTLPPTVIVGRGDVADIPRSWASPTTGVEDGRVGEAFGVDISPFAYVVDEGGAIVARGVVTRLTDVERLVAAGDEITIVGGAGG